MLKSTERFCVIPFYLFTICNIFKCVCIYSCVSVPSIMVDQQYCWDLSLLSEWQTEELQGLFVASTKVSQISQNNYFCN